MASIVREFAAGVALLLATLGVGVLVTDASGSVLTGWLLFGLSLALIRLAVRTLLYYRAGPLRTRA